MVSLKESKAITDLAELFYEFLPGSGSKTWKGHVSFRSIAEDLGIRNYWQPGSKTPMIAALMQRTLDFNRGLFEPLILAIVRHGIVYRQKNSNPIMPDEIDKINGLICELGFKFPDLWDSEFKDSLGADVGSRAKKHLDAATNELKSRASQVSDKSKKLAALQQEFFKLHSESNRQEAGRQLERILNELFGLFGLTPRKAFRVVGEQIDGSFVLDQESYLLEAKWECAQLSEQPLIVFRGKVEGKSQFSRGVLVAINGITPDAKEAITHGKSPNFFVIDGYDLTMVLSGQIDFVDFLRLRRRLLCDDGHVAILYHELVQMI